MRCVFPKGTIKDRYILDSMKDLTINKRGQLMSFEKPVVMGILNATPDSFFADSRKQSDEEVISRAHQIVAEGGQMIDLGACSTRPGGDVCSEEEEERRLRWALPLVRQAEPDAAISVDTFRPRLARMAVEEYGADIINDVSGGSDEMFQTVAALKVPYILMSSASNLHDMLMEMAAKTQQLHALGQKDIILDPGFGFGKTLEENYAIMNELEAFQVMEMPLLVGISRKRMIHQLLDITANESLNGTTVLNTISVMKGADILRVHDVRQAVEAVAIVEKLKSAGEI